MTMKTQNRAGQLAAADLREARLARNGRRASVEARMAKRAAKKAARAAAKKEVAAY